MKIAPFIIIELAQFCLACVTHDAYLKSLNVKLEFINYYKLLNDLILILITVLEV